MACPCNMHEGLLPPKGAWLGSTHWNHQGEMYNPVEYKTEFGRPLHIYRCFKTKPVNITTHERAFVEQGGILWYGFQPRNWKQASGPEYEKTLKNMALAVKSLAPAKVMVCPGFEPDGHCTPHAKPRETFGSPEEYIEFRKKVKDIFDSQGVTNAIWIIDYSSNPHATKGHREAVPKLMPRDGSVQWLFFNVFSMVSEKGYNQQVSKGKTEQPHWDSHHMLKWWYDFLSSDDCGMKDYIKDIPWGVGAWGTTHEDNCPPPWGPKPIPQENRETFLEGMIDAVSGSYPKLKAFVHFNSLNSIISPYDTVVTATADLAHHNAITEYPTSPELAPTLTKFISCEHFTGNDGGIFEGAVTTEKGDHADVMPGDSKGKKGGGKKGGGKKGGGKKGGGDDEGKGKKGGGKKGGGDDEGKGKGNGKGKWKGKGKGKSKGKWVAKTSPEDN